MGETERGDGDEPTVGKYPSVKTLSKLVFPQAPSPMMTSFLDGKVRAWTTQSREPCEMIRDVLGIELSTVRQFMDG